MLLNLTWEYFMEINLSISLIYPWIFFFPEARLVNGRASLSLLLVLRPWKISNDSNNTYLNCECEIVMV